MEIIVRKNIKLKKGKLSEILSKTIANIKPLDTKSMAKAKARQDTLTKPTGSLGRLESLSIQIAGIQGKALPQIKQKAVIVMAADHGVAARHQRLPAGSYRRDGIELFTRRRRHQCHQPPGRCQSHHRGYGCC